MTGHDPGVSGMSHPHPGNSHVHDPMCLLYPSQHAHTETMCSCGLIARVRADEREQSAGMLSAALIVERERIAQAIEAEESPNHTDWGGARVMRVADAARIAREVGS